MPLATRSEETGRGHDLRLGTRVLLGHSSIISLAIRSSWHPIQRESFLFCLTYAGNLNTMRGIKLQSMKLFYINYGGNRAKASNEGGKGGMTGTIKL